CSAASSWPRPEPERHPKILVATTILRGVGLRSRARRRRKGRAMFSGDFFKGAGLALVLAGAGLLGYTGLSGVDDATADGPESGAPDGNAGNAAARQPDAQGGAQAGPSTPFPSGET